MHALEWQLQTPWMNVILSDFNSLYSVLLHLSRPAIRLSLFVIYHQKRRLIAGLHLTLCFSFLWVSEPLGPLTSLYSPRVPWHPFYPVLAATLSLFALHIGGSTRDFTLSKTATPIKTWVEGMHGRTMKINNFTLSFLCHSGHTVPISSFARIWERDVLVRSGGCSSGTWRRQAEIGHVPLSQFRSV